jgi:tetratricopeptide (TPR) repeat protein
MFKPGKSGEIQRRIRKADEYLKAGDLSNAELWFEDALSIDPNNRKALAGLGKVARSRKIREHLSAGLALLDQGDLDGSERELRHVITLEPKNSQAVEGLRTIARLRKPDVLPGPQKKTSGEKSEVKSSREYEALSSYMARTRTQARQRNLDALMISAVLHILVFLILSFFIREVIHTPRDEIPVEWVRVPDPEVPSPRPPSVVPEKKFVFDQRLPGERTVKSLADKASKSDLKSASPSLMAKGIAPKATHGSAPQTFSAVNTPVSDADDLRFSPHETMAYGSGINRPGTSDRYGMGSGNKDMGGLSTLRSSVGLDDGMGGVDLGGIGGRGLVGPDPMDMVSAVTFGRQEQEKVVFLLDISNSMEGNYNRGVYNREWFKKLKRAKISIISSLNSLREGQDYFYLAAFSSNIKLFREELVEANQANLAEARQFIQELRPTSHRERTNMYDALMAALETEPTRIILVSDGLPTEGVVSVRNILKGVNQKNEGTRIYTFATNLGGQEEAQVLLSKMARDNSGRFRNDKMGMPKGIAVNSKGNIYVADITVNVFSDEGNPIKSFGSHTIKLAIGPSDDVHLLFFPDARSSGFGALGICRFDGTQLKSFSSHGYLPRQVYEPWDIAVDSNGNTYVVSTRANRISIFDRNGEYIRSFGAAGMQAYEVGPHERGDSLSGGSRRTHIDRRGVNSSESGYFSRPMGVALDSYDNIYVLDSGNHRVQIFDPQLRFMDKFRIDGYGMAIDVSPQGNYIYVLIGSGTTGGEKLHIYRPNGSVAEKFDVGSGTADIDVDPEGEIYAINFVYDEVNVFSIKGEKLKSFSTLQ